MPCLYDIVQLRPLEYVARHFKIKFTLRGGTAFRLAVANSTDIHDVDLFELNNCFSDIDLIYEGSEVPMDVLRRTIADEVPLAECFSWDIRSRHEFDAFRQRHGYSNLIPARLLEISDVPTDPIGDPANGLRDIKAQAFRFYRHPLFHLSVGYQFGSDLEEISASLYLLTLLEAGIGPDDWAKQPGWNDVLSIFRPRNPALESQFKLKKMQHPGLLERCQKLRMSVAERFVEWQNLSDLSSLLRASDATWLNAGWWDGHGATQLLNCPAQAAQDFHWRWHAQPIGLHMAPGQAILLHSDAVTLYPANTQLVRDSYSHPDQSSAIALISMRDNEVLDRIKNVREIDITAFPILNAPSGPVPLTVPAIVKKRGDYLALRVNLDSVMQCVPQIPDAALSFAVVTWEGGQ